MADNKKITLNDINHDDIELVSSPEEIAQIRAQLSDNTPVDRTLLNKVINGSEGLAAGIGQGIVGGSGDELGGALAATVKSFADKGYVSYASPIVPQADPEFTKNYTTARDYLRNKYSQIKNDAPGTTELGEFAGGFYAPLPSTIAPILKLKELQKGKEIRNILQNITRGTIEGGMVGSEFAAGNSTAPVVNAEGLSREGAIKLADDMERGAGYGGALGAGAATLHSAKDIGSLSPSIKQFFDVADLERRGIPMNANKRGQDLLATLKLATQKLRGIKKQKAEELNQALANSNKELSPDTIDALLARIQELKTPAPSGQPKNQANIDDNYVADLERLEGIIKDYRYGKEVTKEVPTFKPGNELPDVTETVQNKLNDKQSLLSAADASGQGEEQAINKLKTSFAKKQMNNGSDSPFAPSLVDDAATGETGFKVYNPEDINLETGEITPNGTTVEVIKRANPGEIITIPMGDKQVMGFKLKSGKFYGKIVPNAPNSSLPAGPRTEITPSTKDITVRADEGNLAPITPSSLRTLQQTVKDIPYGDATATKTQGGETVAKEVEAKLRKQLGVDVPEFKKPLNDLAELNNVTDPIETNKGFTEDQKDEAITANLFNLLQKARQDPVAQRKAMKLLATVRRVAPEEAQRIEHLQEKLRQYNLSTKAEKSQQPIMATQNPITAVIGAVPSLMSKGAAGIGKMQRGMDNIMSKADDVIKWVEGNPTHSQSGAGRKVVASLRKLAGSGLRKPGVAANEVPERSRNAILFALMQDPGSRELMQKYNDANNTKLFDEGEEVVEGQ